MTIIFDLGGVLVNLDWNKVCTPLSRLSGLNRADVQQEVVNGPIVQSSMLGQLNPQEFQQAICAKLHVDLTFGPFIEIWNDILSVNDDMVQLVSELRPAHSMILASNTDAIHFAYSRKHFDVLKNFDRFFLSFQMGLLKPERAYFEYVLDGLQAEPGDCLFIDDRPENVQSAQDCGIKALVFTSAEQLKADLAKIL